MRRRMWFALTVVMAASLAVGVGFAGAASPKKSGKAKVKQTTVHCNVSLTTEPPPGSNSVDQPAAQGNQYGPIHCGTAGFGGGVAADSFTVPDSGDTVGTYAEYFGAGTITGAFDLTPQESSGITNFSSETWTGTVTVTGGTGVYKGIKGAKVGMMNCSSDDSVHLTCTETVKVKMPSATG